MARALRTLQFTCAIGALGALAAPQAAEAGAFAIREQSAWGQGSSFAGMAAGGSLSTMFWNPATLSGVDGIQIENVITGVVPFTDVDYSGFLPGPTPVDGSDEIGIDALVPAGYAAMRLNEDVVVGVGINGAYGLATKYGMDEAIRAVGVAGTSKVFSLNLNPAVSYDVTDWLTVAVGAQLQYLDLHYTAVGLPTPLGVSSIDADDFAMGLTAGVLLRPREGTEIGVGYRSRINHELEGTLSTSGSGDLDATGDGFNLPDVVTVGLRQSITDEVRVSAGVEWSNWSRFDTVDLDAPPAAIPLDFDYEDGWFFSAGIEYDLMPNLTLRTGIGYELSPITDDNRTFRLPDNDRLWLSAGASYAWNDRWSFDAGYSLVLVDDTDIQSSTGGGPVANGPYSGEAETTLHLIALGAKMKLGALGAAGH